MVIGTRALSTVFLLALAGFVKQGMIRLFFPAMTHVACSPTLAARQVIVNHVLGLPVNAWNGIIRVNRGVPSVILPVVSIHASRSIMDTGVWAELSL